MCVCAVPWQPTNTVRSSACAKILRVRLMSVLRIKKHHVYNRGNVLLCNRLGVEWKEVEGARDVAKFSRLGDWDGGDRKRSR